jgi:hypothetical protein
VICPRSANQRFAKNVFQVHGVDANERVVFNKPLRRSQVLPFFAKLAPCLPRILSCLGGRISCDMKLD